MVYDTISDNLIQIGLSIHDTLSYDIVLKKHISKITEFTVQFANIPLPPVIDVYFTDITNTPNVLLGTVLAIGDAAVHTVTPLGEGTPETCGRIIRIWTDNALTNDNILYVKIMFDTI